MHELVEAFTAAHPVKTDKAKGTQAQSNCGVRRLLHRRGYHATEQSGL